MAGFIIQTVKKTLGRVILFTFATSAVILACNAWVAKTARDRCYKSLEEIPATPVGLVLGTAPTVNHSGMPNLFFTKRIQAAADLFKAGKVRALIVSGDNSLQSYDEPTAMKLALIDAGVPEDRIFCDYAGLRTLDSVVRAKSIFGQSHFTIISQHFHNERAVFLALHHDLNVEAYDAQDIPHSAAPAVYAREYVARVQAVMDILTKAQPKFAGPPVKIQGL